MVFFLILKGIKIVYQCPYEFAIPINHFIINIH